MEVFLNLKKLFNIITKEEQFKLKILFIFMLIGMLFETLGIAIVVPVVGFLAEGNYAEKYPQIKPILEFLGNPSQQQIMLIVLGLLVLFYIIKNIYLAYLTWRQSKFTATLYSSISNRLFDTYLHQPYGFYLKHNSAQLIRNVMGEVSAFGLYGIQSALLLLTEVIIMVGVLALLMFFYPLVTLAAIVILSLTGFVYYYFTKVRILKWGEKRQLHEGMRLKHLQQGLGGIKDVKLSGNEAYFYKQFREHTNASNDVGQRQSITGQIPRFLIELVIICSIVALIAVIIIRDNSTENVMPVITMFGMATFRLMPAVTRIIMALQNLKFGVPVVNLLSHELHDLKRAAYVPRGEPLPFHHAVEVKNVVYKYDEEKEILKNISFEIKKGETVGFVGESGAGKSTMADIILGLLSPHSGEVRVDGVDIASDVVNWQQNIGYVPQSIYLTDDSLRRNVAFGIEDADIDDEKVWNALKMAQLEKFIAKLGEGLDTFVGERGVRLSGGQRQRIGIARALYHNPTLLLLDEATSALDTQTEARFMEMVKSFQGDKTIIIIAHRLSTVEHCDRIFAFSAGNIAHVGTPEVVLPLLKTAHEDH